MELAIWLKELFLTSDVERSFYSFSGTSLS